ncbi:hypothetical protein Lesp02_28890 [Lentzea sp. NBRC 105346]|uniref:hypothetical protein n=1 Tax=Lentzea sp. NBRC 105346 TaxID=3032205 RepID=UPI002553890D|nr:hypothetical protein [Lentzea sp. NBRC 105346]GLZ30700.1 hypothetical protein Lesp02_28890 [Lentzea sp. NBRC 105346]
MTPPPLAVRVAAGCWLATAVFTVLTVVGLWLLRGELAAKAGVPVSDVTNLLVSLSIVSAFFAVAYGWLTVQLYRARRWTRAVLSVIAVGHMLWLLIVGVSASSLVTLLLLSVAIVLTWQPSAAKWMAEVGA